MRQGNLAEERDERENQDRPETRGEEKETVLENRKSAQVPLSSLSGPRALQPGLGEGAPGSERDAPHSLVCGESPPTLPG